MNINMLSDEDLLKKVTDWVEELPDDSKFDPSFIESLSEAFGDYGDLTLKQRSAVINIIESYRI